MASKFPIGNVIFFLINHVHAHNFLKEWRMEILGKLKSKAIGLMNKAEVKWYERKSFGEQYILCDQLTMAVLIRPKVAAKTILHQVLNFHLALFFWLLTVTDDCSRFRTGK